LAELRAFEATVRLGGLARAAIELNITTSAISHVPLLRSPASKMAA